MTVTRANEAMREDFMEQVRAEHREIAHAIAAHDTERARQAATTHMLRAARRIEEADASVRAALSDALVPRRDPLKGSVT
jgi:GntR family transcriptional regulator, transcriptional repressor for pyruvate dehydrogenase complex